MATPLLPSPSSQLNFSSPSTNRRYEKDESYEASKTHATNAMTQLDHEEVENHGGEGDDSFNNSSPFVSQVKDGEEEVAAAGAAPAEAAPAEAAPAAEKSPPPASKQEQTTSPVPSAKPARPVSRVLSGTELSPLKILQSPAVSMPAATAKATGESNNASDAPPSMVPPTPRTKAFSPVKRFPVKISQPNEESSTRRADHERQINLGDAVRENEGLKHAIEIFEDESSTEGDDDGGDIVVTTITETRTSTTTTTEDDNGITGADEEDENDAAAAADDTMVSTFSTFSAVPNLTVFGRGGSSSPTRSTVTGGATPRARATLRSSGASTRDMDGATTTNLMDFTEQLRFGNYTTPSRARAARGISPSRTTPNLANLMGAACNTPSRHVRSNGPYSSVGEQNGDGPVNLLDFDIPPLPTPRSIPSITPRELESLKSGFLSEISSLRASLLGKEAEVASLKTAVGDAETRVGAGQEALREAQARADVLAEQRDGWERRGREMEAVLRSAREEMMLNRREMDELERRLDEADKRREAAEMMAQEAESKMAGMRAGKEAAAAAAADGGPSSTQPSSAKDVEMAVERVARELHALYKAKHETKVSALKKSYENRWEKRVRELQREAEELARENEELRVGRDATMTRLDPAKLEAATREAEDRAARDAARLSELAANVDRLAAEAKAVQADNKTLRDALETERVEKGELVILAEELMSMQQSFTAPSTSSSLSGHASSVGPEARRTPSAKEKSMMGRPLSTSAVGLGVSSASRTSTTPRSTRTSGLRAPGAMGLKGGESRIGMGRGVTGGTAQERGRSAGGGSAIGRPGSGLAVRSGIMSSIEKMGSYHRRGE